MRRVLAAALAAAAVTLTGGPAQAALLVTSTLTNQVLQYDDAGNFVRVAAQGNGLTSPGGFAFGPGGDLFVVTRSTHQVLRFDGGTGAFEGVFASTAGIGSTLTSSLVSGPGGDLFVGGFAGATGYVARFDGATGASEGLFTGPLTYGVRSLTFGPGGDLFVAGSNGNVYRFDGATGVAEGVLTGFSGDTSDLAFGRDGSLFLVENGRVDRIDVTTGALTGRIPAGAFGFGGIAVGPDGDLYLSRPALDLVDRYDGTTLAFEGQLFQSRGGVNEPTFLAFAPAAPSAVPEPASVALLGLGAAGLIGRRLRRKAIA